MKNVLTKQEFLGFKRGKKLLIVRIILLILVIYFIPAVVAAIMSSFIARMGVFPAPAKIIIIILFIFSLTAFIIVSAKAKLYRKTFGKLYDSKGNDFKKQVLEYLETLNIEKLAELLDRKPECSNEDFISYLNSIGYVDQAIINTSITDSRLLGASISFFFFNLLCGILTVITLGIAYPFIVVMKEKYLAKRTYTTGHRNMFDGNGFQLIGKYILWLFLTVITFGIYSIFLITKLIAWKTAHTHFFDSEVKESKYTGNGFVRYFLNIALTILAGITLGLAYPFKVCALQRYDKNNSIIDGYKLRFTGTAMQYFGKHILWTLLSIVTIGIFYIFVPFKKQRWIREHTIIDETYANTIQPKKVEVVEDVRPEIAEEIKVEENAVEENIENNSGSENKENVVEESSNDETIIEDNKEEI